MIPARAPRSFEVTLEDDNEWRRAALARRGRPFTSNDIVKLVGPPPSPNLLPSLVRAAHSSAMIQKSDTAPIGTVWVGVQPDSKSIPRTGGSRKTDEANVSRDLWQKARETAAKKKISTGEVLIRALRA